jgi:hypothetical protein
VSDSPFLPGARVAIEKDRSHYSPIGYTEGVIEKVHKSGRFALVGSSQQWRPARPDYYDNYWTAVETGSHGWSGHKRLRVWDDVNDQEIRDAIATNARYYQFQSAQQEISRLRFSDLVTADVLTEMISIVNAVKVVQS